MLKVSLCQSLILGLKQSFAKTSTIKPVILANLMI